MKTTVLRSNTIFITILFVAITARVGAQSLEPRTYANTPVGMNFLITGYGYANGSIIADASVPLENAEIENHELVLGYARAIDFWGKAGKFDLILPYAWASGSAEYAGESHERQVDGFGDPKFRVSVNFLGAPALSLKEFLDYKQDLIIGASLQIGVPMGQYDADRLLNVGTNRWMFRPELGLSKAFGPLTFEIAAGVYFYTDNSEFLGDKTKSQDPLFSFQAHLIYNMRSGIWVAMDGTYYTGGSSTVEGMEESDRQENSRIGLTAALPINRHHSLKLFAASGVSARLGGDFDNIGLAWQYRWGGGFRIPFKRQDQWNYPVWRIQMKTKCKFVVLAATAGMSIRRRPFRGTTWFMSLFNSPNPSVAVNDYGCTLGALALNPSGFCSVGANNS